MAFTRYPSEYCSPRIFSLIELILEKGAKVTDKDLKEAEGHDLLSNLLNKYKNN